MVESYRSRHANRLTGAQPVPPRGAGGGLSSYGLEGRGLVDTINVEKKGASFEVFFVRLKRKNQDNTILRPLIPLHQTRSLLAFLPFLICGFTQAEDHSGE